MKPFNGSYIFYSRWIFRLFSFLKCCNFSMLHDTVDTGDVIYLCTFTHPHVASFLKITLLWNWHFLILKNKLIYKKIISFSESTFKMKATLGRKHVQNQGNFRQNTFLDFAGISSQHLKWVWFVFFCSAFFYFIFHSFPGSQIV